MSCTLRSGASLYVFLGSANPSDSICCICCSTTEKSESVVKHAQNRDSFHTSLAFLANLPKYNLSTKTKLSSSCSTIAGIHDKAQLAANSACNPYFLGN